MSSKPGVPQCSSVGQSADFASNHYIPSREISIKSHHRCTMQIKDTEGGIELGAPLVNET
jgi:hypothetical protein